MDTTTTTTCTTTTITTTTTTTTTIILRPLSGTTRVSRYQKDEPFWIVEAEIMG